MYISTATPQTIQEAIIKGVRSLAELRNITCLVLDFQQNELVYQSHTLLYIDEAPAKATRRNCPNPYWSYVPDDTVDLLIQLKRKGLECARKFPASDFDTHICITDYPIIVDGKEVFIHQKFQPLTISANKEILLGLFTISTSASKEMHSYIETASGEMWEYNFKSLQYEESRQRIHLTNKEMDILRCLVKRMGTEEIAEALGMTINTVRKHRRNIYIKLGAHSKDEVIIIANNYHLLTTTH